MGQLSPGTRPGPPRPRLGTHISSGGRLATVPRRAADMGAEAVQIFLGNPRGWATPPGDTVAEAAFRDGAAKHDLTVLIHSAYLVNLGSPTAETYRRSATSVEYALARGAAVGAAGVVVHTGSGVTDGGHDMAMRQVQAALLPMLDDVPGSAPDLLLEPTAGQGRSLCATVDDLGPYLEMLRWHPKVKVCFDTCHAFAAGADLATPGGMTATLDRLIEVIGTERLAAVHANDSMDRRGALRDRHERIGLGHIGREPFRELLAHPAVARVPVVLETPGGPAAHAEDLGVLREMRAS